MDSKLEARLVKLSYLSPNERLHLPHDTADVQGHLQVLDHLSSLTPPEPSRTKMWAGHALLMASIEDSRPEPRMARLFGRIGRTARTVPVALTVTAILATSSSAAVITDVTGTGSAFAEVLAALGIKETPKAVDEPVPAVTPSAEPPKAPLKTAPAAIEDEPPYESTPDGDLSIETERNDDHQVTPREQDVAPRGQGGEIPGIGGANGVGQGGTPPGKGGENPGNGGANGVGQGGTPQGKSGENPGNGGGQNKKP